MKKRWIDKEGMRDNLASNFVLFDPKGHRFETNRLQDFCQVRNLPYVVVWNNSRQDRPIKKGIAKNWRCIKI